MFRDIFSSFWAVALEGPRTNLLFGNETLGRKANPCSMCGTRSKKGSKQKNVIHLVKLQSETAQTSEGCSHKTCRGIQSRSRLYLSFPDCTRTVLEQELSNFIEGWNFRINFGNSMVKNHSPGKQLCGSVQDSINNLTTGKYIKAIASRSTATATLA